MLFSEVSESDILQHTKVAREQGTEINLGTWAKGGPTDKATPGLL